MACLLTVFCLLAAVGWYCPLILRRRVNPAPATWIIACLAMNIGSVSFYAMPGRRAAENVTLYSAAFEITLVLMMLLTMLWRSGQLVLAFDRLQQFCLAVMGVIVTYWIFYRGESNVTFWSMQGLLLVSYVATIMKAVQTRTAFDSIGNWSLILLASVIGTIPAVVLASPYGIGNSVRAVLSSAITVGTLLYFDRINGHPRWKDEVATLRNFYRLRGR